MKAKLKAHLHQLLRTLDSDLELEIGGQQITLIINYFYPDQVVNHGLQSSPHSPEDHMIKASH